jgi:branched-chain amino acid transport system ATP-binding protein
MSDHLLVVENLCKNFDGLLAVDCVSINFQAKKVHAIIGPNGAGKTTLINLLSGDLLPSLGRITFKDRDLTDMSAFAIAQLGIGRSYQKTNIFPDLTCWQNCWVGAQSRLSTSMRFLKPAREYSEIHRQTKQALALCCLENRFDTLASEMSYGEQRQLEISMMLATEPELLLLDEPLSGMGTSETQKMIELIKRLARDRTIILIEHDMDAVFALADALTVMVNGKVLATGTPKEIRNSQDVQDAYLGTEEGNK